MEKLQRIGRRGGNLVQDAFRLRRIALVKQRLRERNLVVDRLQIGHGAERTRRACLVLLRRLRLELSGERWIELLRRALRAGKSALVVLFLRGLLLRRRLAGSVLLQERRQQPLRLRQPGIARLVVSLIESRARLRDVGKRGDRLRFERGGGALRECDRRDERHQEGKLSHHPRVAIGRAIGRRRPSARKAARSARVDYAPCVAAIRSPRDPRLRMSARRVTPAAQNAQVESRRCSMRNPASPCPTICEIDCKDWFRPRTTPCSSRPTCWVMRLVSAGRTKPLPMDEKVAATSSKGIP